MNVFVITACYNFENTIDKYVETFNNSYIEAVADLGINTKDFNIRFIFVNDQPGTDEILRKALGNLVKTPQVKYSIHPNEKNIGVTLSRNWAARAIFDVFCNQITPKDRIIYFDSDDTWDIQAVRVLYLMKDLKPEFIFYPIDVKGREMNKECVGEMELGKFCTYIPMQECIYCWSVNYAYRFMRQYGFLWYEDENKCKYYPEDMMFHLNPKHKCYIIPQVICHRGYENGSITKDWWATAKANIPAFKKLIAMHRINMHRYEYSAELIKYVNYMTKVVYEDSDNK